MQRPDNHLNGVLAKIAFLPETLRLRAFDWAFGRYTRAYRTLGIRTHRLGPTRVEMTLKNRARMRNHIGGIHGVICQVPGEYASGVLIAHWTPKSAIVVVKSITANVYKPVRGDIRSVVEASEQVLRPLMEQEKGEFTLEVKVYDETGECPMTCDVTMAWIPKSRTK